MSTIDSIRFLQFYGDVGIVDLLLQCFTIGSRKLTDCVYTEIRLLATECYVRVVQEAESTISVRDGDIEFLFTTLQNKFKKQARNTTTIE